VTPDPAEPIDPSIETDAEIRGEKELESAIEKAETERPKSPPAPDHANDGGIF
jgi:hypothetical protein